MKNKILIAEDSSVISNLLKRILSGQNYTPIVVKNGQEVLDEVAKHDDIDLILLDINMPEMNGIDCAKKLKKNKNKIPIIAITGNANNFTLEEFQAVGIINFISKPLNYDKLLDIVKNQLLDAQ